MFAKAVGSAEVKGGLTGQTSTLAFLDEGDYELHFVAYNKDSDNGRFVYAARLQSETNVDGSVGNIIKVKAGAAANLASTIKGII